MARTKADLTRLNLNQLEQITGSTYRSVVKVLSNAKIEPIISTEDSKYYDAKDALWAIFEAQGMRGRPKIKFGDPDDPDEKKPIDEEKILEPGYQSARLNREKTKKIQIEIEMMLKKLIPSSEVERVWTDMILASRAKLNGFGDKIAPRLIGFKDVKKIAEQINKEIRQALEELKEYDPEQYFDSVEEGDEKVGPSSTDDDQ